MENSVTITFDSWTTDRKTVRAGVEFQFGLAGSSNNISPKVLFAAHQTQGRSGPANKTNNTAIFDNVDVEQCLLQIDCTRYPRDALHVDYAKNDYLNHNRDHKTFDKPYVKETLSNPFLPYPDMKNFYAIHVFDLRFQVDHK